MTKIITSSIIVAVALGVSACNVTTSNHASNANGHSTQQNENWLDDTARNARGELDKDGPSAVPNGQDNSPNSVDTGSFSTAGQLIERAADDKDALDKDGALDHNYDARNARGELDKDRALDHNYDARNARGELDKDGALDHNYDARNARGELDKDGALDHNYDARNARGELDKDGALDHNYDARNARGELDKDGALDHNYDARNARGELDKDGALDHNYDARNARGELDKDGALDHNYDARNARDALDKDGASDDRSQPLSDMSGGASKDGPNAVPNGQDNSPNSVDTGSFNTAGQLIERAADDKDALDKDGASDDRSQPLSDMSGGASKDGPNAVPNGQDNSPNSVDTGSFSTAGQLIERAADDKDALDKDGFQDKDA